MKDRKEWKKLIGVGPNKTSKIISLSRLVLGRIGFKHEDELEGRWMLNDGKLYLEIRKIEE